MTTELKRFTEAYATMTVAAYEPLVLRWVSLLGIRFLSDTLAYRLPKAAAVKYDGKIPAALALSRTLRVRLPRKIEHKVDHTPMRVPIDIHGRAVEPGAVTKINVPGFPNAVAIGKDVYLRGFTSTDPVQLFKGEPGFHAEVMPPAATLLSRSALGAARFTQGLKSIPLVVSGRLGVQRPNFDFLAARDTVQEKLVRAAREWSNDPNGKDLMQLMAVNASVGNAVLPHLWPSVLGLQEALSPVGIAHYYRQHYFNIEEGVGPIEEAFTIAPLETFEVVYQTVRKQTHEEILEQGLEIVSEAAQEQKNLDEVSDKVSSLVQQDVSASMSANASGGVGVWQVGASATGSFALSAQRSREFSTRRLKEVTKRASERITKSFAIKTRDVTEVTETTTTRRVIRNDGDEPVSYGLRRVLRRVNVKVQDLGPRLVWQLYLRNPGQGLARSRFVHFRESAPIAVPDVPPGVPPRPSGGAETETTSTAILYDVERELYFVVIVVRPGADRDVTGVRIDTVTDLGGGGKDDEAPAPLNDWDLGSSWDPDMRTYTAIVAVYPGSATSVQVSYSYTWEPSASVLDAWEAQRAAAVAELTEDALSQQFEQNKALITERSKIRARPANDLRFEERYELMNRMVSYLFGRGDDPSEPTPLEIEYFHRYFDIEGVFAYTHPSWWKPRFAFQALGFEREAYEIAAESEPAPMGSSLGWLIQLDGDRRRNEFLNSAWARVCIPIRPGREREALRWLARYLEGEVGFNINNGPMADLLADVEKYRERENKLGLGGADYVTVTSTPGAPADPLEPEGVYPIVDEFVVTVPTEGFVYDELKLVVP